MVSRCEISERLPRRYSTYRDCRHLLQESFFGRLLHRFLTFFSRYISRKRQLEHALISSDEWTDMVSDTALYSAWFFRTLVTGLIQDMGCSHSGFRLHSITPQSRDDNQFEY